MDAATAIKSTGGSSQRFGACEVCGEHATEVFFSSGTPDYVFGHRDCVERAVGFHAAKVAAMLTERPQVAAVGRILPHSRRRATGGGR